MPLRWCQQWSGVSLATMVHLPYIGVGNTLLIEIFREEGQAAENQNAQVQLEYKALLLVWHVAGIPMKKRHQPDPETLGLEPCISILLFPIRYIGIRNLPWCEPGVRCCCGMRKLLRGHDGGLSATRCV